MMRHTMLMAGLLAGLVGTMALAQTTTPEPDTSATAEAPPMPPMAEGNGPGRGFGRGDRMGPLGLAPLETYDTDGDGIVTQPEIEARKAERFGQADADRNGALSPEELIALEDQIRQEMRLARATRAVERMDDNGDGLLQAEEIEARSPRLAPIFDRLDADGDRGISLEEIEAGRPGRGEGRGGRGHGHGG
ncbi:EF-hand domain-containing protein [Rubellimicrobium roseum]|nr:calcium sensor EFh [Rubellimicrobium roseum]